MVNEHDLIAMTEDRPGDNLRKGDVGTVVHLYPDGQTYEIEFIDEHGRTRCIATVPTSQVMRLNYLSLSA